MKTRHWLNYIVIIFIAFTTFLHPSTPKVVYAQDLPAPWFSARLLGTIDAWQFSIDKPVTLIIDGVTIESKTPRVVSDDPFFTEASFSPGEAGYYPGQEITVTNGDFTKSLIVSDMKIDNVDVETDTISGTAAPGLQFYIAVCYGDSCQYRWNLSPDAGGNWSVDFKQPGAAYEPAIDLIPGMYGEIVAPDEDGDFTAFGWHVPAPPDPVVPSFSAMLKEGSIAGGNWAVDKMVELKINGTAVATSLPEVVSADPYYAVVQFQPEGWSFAPGDEITLDNGEFIKTLLVADIKIDNVDVETDTISGTGPAGYAMNLLVAKGNDWIARRAFIIDGTGTWSVDFSVPGENFEEGPADIIPGMYGEVYNTDEDGDSTSYSWYVPVPPDPIVPGFTAQLKEGSIGGGNWAVDKLVELKINGTAVAASLPEVVSVDPYYAVVQFQPEGWSFAPGDEITLDNGEFIKTLVVADIKIDNVDVETDRISGTGPAGYAMILLVAYGNDWIARRAFIIDGTGTWSVDFSVPGENFGEDPADIIPNMYGEVYNTDEDGDSTSYSWYVPVPPDPVVPGFTAQLKEGYVEGGNWATDKQVTLKINGVAVATSMPEVVSVDPHNTFVVFWPDGWSFGPGDEVILDNGEFVKTLIVTDIKIDSIDVETDTISGTGPAGYTLHLLVVKGDPWVGLRTFTISESGKWSVDFSVPGVNFGEEPVDLIPGMSGGVWTTDEDGDATSYSWSVELDSDGDTIPDSIDNAPTVPNPDQRDTDNDGKADVIDPCPNDSTDSCNIQGSGAKAIGSEGGVLQTENGLFTMIVPENALANNTSLSVTDKGGGMIISTNEGPIQVVASADIEPHGTTFATPITVVMGWLDENQDGIVDGTGIREGDMVISKNGIVLTGKCSMDAGCDVLANTFSVKVSSLSRFSLGSLLNHPPIAVSLIAPFDPVSANSSVNASLIFTDPDANDLHQVKWDWGDGSSSIGVVNQVTKIANGSHVYSLPGVYVVTATVTDSFGESGRISYSYIVVFDPSAGFVTGSGQGYSLPGYYLLDPTSSGKIKLGFDSKYHKFALFPKGETRFELTGAKFDFKSTSYLWMVVNGAKAQFCGSGAVNGKGDYGFLVTIIDGNQSADLFRIKIWDKSTGLIVYDNQPGANNNADPTMVVDKGSIKIHN